MQSRGTKILRRRYRSLKRSLSRAGSRSLGHTRSYLIERGANLRNVQRRVVLWIVLVFVLISATAVQIVINRGAFTTVATANGGTYVEGAVGEIETLNPILATTASELSASRLLFTGLFDYDATGSIRPALATAIKTDDAKTFTITLRKGVIWSDGKPFTSADVVYTVTTIQATAVRSPLAASFRDVVISAPDASTVKVVLPTAYAPFVHSLTFGILPEHVLRDVAPGDIRSASFNLDPVTLGAFTFTSFRERDANGNPIVYASANGSYFRPASRIERFQLHAYKDQAALLRAYQRREVGAIAGVSIATAIDAQKRRGNTRIVNAPIDNGDYAFFNTRSELYGDAALRAAIRQGTDVTAIRRIVGGDVAPLNGPVLASEVPGVASLVSETGNVDGAKAALETLGWKAGTNGLRSKDGVPLVMRLAAIDNREYRAIVDGLSRQWRALGIDVRVMLQASDTASEQLLIPRAYDVLVYELPIGADPDVYAYWHSSQNGQLGTNFSGYSSGIADDNLASSRATLDTQLRDAKYVAFTKQWLADTPAIPLFQQSYHYVTGDDVTAINTDDTIVTPTDRYADVNEWTVDMRRVLNTP